MKTIWEARKKILGLATVALMVLLMMNLNTRLGEYFRLTNERDNMLAQVGNLEATKMALETQMAYATSEKAVEDWARNEAHLARPGDKVIIPLTPVGQTPEPRVQVTVAPTTVENWEVWWALFFGE